MKINSLTFTSNEEHMLVCGEIELPYTFRNREYYITFLNEQYEPIIQSLNSNFNVEVKYSFNHNGIATDLDSDFSLTKTIAIFIFCAIIT